MRRKITKGCPQGSVVGPLLWIVGYNVVLKWLKSRWMKHFCYADDTILLLTGDSLKEVTMKIYRATEALIVQLEKIGLALNLKKTEVENKWAQLKSDWLMRIMYGLVCD